MGVAATLVVLSLLFGVVGLPLYPRGQPEGAVPTGLAWYVFCDVQPVDSSVLLFLAFFLGNLVVGVVAPSSPGLNGAVSAVGVVALAFAWLLATVLPGLLRPISSPGDVYTRTENLQMFLIYAVALCFVLPFAALAGFLGGRLGRRLRAASRL